MLELREELSRAESELTRLKKHWTHSEGRRKRAEGRNVESLRPLAAAVAAQTDTPTSPNDPGSSRRSVDLDRRKALLLGQQSEQATPTQSRRKVFRGGHTRTLSLLVPAKSIDGFAVHEDPTGLPKPPMKDSEPQFQSLNRHGPDTAAQLSKRASWAPRSVHQSGVKQIAEDFKAGLWNFVEDLRQATVGDEPIHGGGGNPMRPGDGIPNAGGLSDAAPGDQDTIRASATTGRTHVASAFEDTPTPPSRFADPTRLEFGNTSRHKRNVTIADAKPSRSSSRTKHFSWTPLTVDSYDDNDWSSWDSPTVKSPRWSGTTINGDIIPTIPEKGDENDTSV